ncbi:type 1 glutamine amidotransferase [Luteococcus sp. Sow4_B9]|uniref:type 1 glutamine amidotransferase n=1 Tax=Luteococcus sp. Sow4_B9 TaxID=3438792 RepID=UPI003F94B3FF
MAKKPRITVLQPEADVPLERFDTWLREGVRITLIDLATKDVPNLETIGDGLVVLGGRMSVEADLRWIGQVEDLMADAQAIDLPVLGICLGHQLLARALGGTVLVGDPRGAEEGPVVLEWLPASREDPVLAEAARLAAPVPMSHHDTVDQLPAGAVELARSATHPNQAFRLGSALGVQFHPEASPELMQYWWAQEHRSRATTMLDRMRAVDHAVEPAARSIALGFAQQVVENA